MCHSHHHARRDATANVEGVRASDREREQAANTLQGAAAEGRLTIPELEDRLQKAWAASTRDQLAGLTVDLGASFARVRPGIRWFRHPALIWVVPVALWLLSSTLWRAFGLQ